MIVPPNKLIHPAPSPRNTRAQERKRRWKAPRKARLTLRLQDHHRLKMVPVHVGKFYAPQELFLSQMVGDVGQVKRPLAVVALVQVVLVLKERLVSEKPGRTLTTLKIDWIIES